MELTKKDLEQVLEKKISGLATTSALKESEKRIIARIDDAQEELARITSNGFEDVMNSLDVRERMNKLETDMSKIKTALHLS